MSVYFYLLLYWLLWLSCHYKQMLDSVFNIYQITFWVLFFLKLRSHWAHRLSSKELINILRIWSFLVMPKEFTSIVFFLICNSEFYNILQKMSARLITQCLLLHADLNNFLTSYFSCSLLCIGKQIAYVYQIFHSLSLL